MSSIHDNTRDNTLFIWKITLPRSKEIAPSVAFISAIFFIAISLNKEMYGYTNIRFIVRLIVKERKTYTYNSRLNS